MNLLKETQQMPSSGLNDESNAFSLKMMGEKAIIKQAKQDNIAEIFVSWKEGKIEIKREMF